LAVAGLVYALPLGNEHPKAVASVDWTEGLTVGFSSEGSYDPDGYIESYYWDFRDGHASEEPNPVHTYREPGEYTVILAVMDDEGETGEDTAYVYVGNGLPLPDLVITESKFEGDPPGSVTVVYYIRNQGEAVAAPSITHLYLGDRLLSESEVKSLAPGEVAISEFPALELTMEQISGLLLHADVTNNVIEIDEENNSMARVEPP
jgi:PKD repeat protein